MAQITEEVLASQVALRDGTTVDMPTEPLVRGGRSLELEKLFPSVSLEFGAFDVSTMSGTLSVASFWGAAEDWPFVRTPTSWKVPRHYIGSGG